MFRNVFLNLIYGSNTLTTGYGWHRDVGDVKLVTFFLNLAPEIQVKFTIVAENLQVFRGEYTIFRLKVHDLLKYTIRGFGSWTIISLKIYDHQTENIRKRHSYHLPFALTIVHPHDRIVSVFLYEKTIFWGSYNSEYLWGSYKF